MTGKFLTCARVLFSRSKYGFFFGSVSKYLGSQKKGYPVKLFRKKVSMDWQKSGFPDSFGNIWPLVFLMQLCASYSYSWTSPSFYTKQNQSKWESFTQKWCKSGRNRLSLAVLGVGARWSLRSHAKKHSVTLWYFTMDLHLFFSPVIHGNQQAQCEFSSSSIYLAWLF